MRNVKVAATQMTGGWDVAENIAKAEALVREAAAQGANIILLQELFERNYFCQKHIPAYLAFFFINSIQSGNAEMSMLIIVACVLAFVSFESVVHGWPAFGVDLAGDLLRQPIGRARSADYPNRDLAYTTKSSHRHRITRRMADEEETSVATGSIPNAPNERWTPMVMINADSMRSKRQMPLNELLTAPTHLLNVTAQL